MPYRLDTHVLTVDANVIHRVDTANPANLHSMWTVFSRCAESVEQGRRLENLSWRVWQKEQLVDEKKSANATSTQTSTLPQNIITADPKLPDVPQLSGSVESVADEEAVEEFTSVSAPLEIVRPRIHRLDSSSKRERHISSDDFEKMILSIVKDKAPLSTANQKSTPMAPRKKTQMPTPTIQRSGSTTTESQSPSKHSDTQSDDSHPSPKMASRTNVVRGFSPSQSSIPKADLPPTSQPSINEADIPAPTSFPASKPVASRKGQANFTLGASYSSSEQGQSVETRKPLAMPEKKAQFHLGVSSEEEASVKGSLRSPARASGLPSKKKQASFSNKVVTHTMEPQFDNAIESDSEGEYVDESAIDDDDDSSDWEDSNEDSNKSSVDDKFFQRVDSKVNLTSRRSLITLMLADTEDRAKNLGGHASQSTSAISQTRGTRQGPGLAGSPNDSDESPLMMKGKRQSTLRPINEVPRSNAQPITMPSRSNAQAASSPRTTRRNMLATELPESLRRQLLLERSQKTSTANAVLKRRHTSHDVANLKQYPEKSCMKTKEDANVDSWNQYFSKEPVDGYHSKGW